MLFERKAKCHIKLTAYLLIAAIMPFSPKLCQANTLWSGSLNAGTDPVGGLTATEGWNSSGTIISWTVTDNTTHYHYSYTFEVPETGKSVSHSIIQVSDTFGDRDAAFVNASLDPAGPTGLYAYLDDYSGTDPSNPGMLGSIWGIKFENVEDDNDDNDFFGQGRKWIWSFNSLREPVWGDFYAKASNDVYAYNTSFGFPHTINDPFHIATPDTNVIPLPPAVLLGMLGMGIAGVKLRKFA